MSLRTDIRSESKVLDREMAGWFTLIRIDDIDMMYTGKCIAGQLKWPEIIQKSQRDTTNGAYCIKELDESICAEAAGYWIEEVKMRDRDLDGNMDDGSEMELT